MSTVLCKIHRARPGARRLAARWLALAVLAAAAAGFAATPALADSAVTVTTTSDENNAGDGACSLREAILYAENLNGSNTDCGVKATGTTTINVPAGPYDVPMVAAGAHLAIGPGGPGPIVIAGAGTTGTIIDAQGVRPRLLLVGADANVTIKNLTLQGGVVTGFGEDGDGAGIDNRGTLTLDHVVVTANKTQFPIGAPPGAGRGGGIYNSGTLTLLDSIVSGNSTDNGQPGFFTPHSCGASGTDGSPGPDGGGLYNQGGSVTAINTVFADNATGAGGDGTAGRDARSFSGCTAGGFGGLASHGGDGGGIFNNAGFVTLRGSAIYGNTTGAGGRGGQGGFGSFIGGFGGEGGGGGAGAGIANNAILTVINTTITGNATGNGTAGGAGGLSDNPGGSEPNGAGGYGGPGGGIYQENGQASVQESTVALNTDGIDAGTEPLPAADGIEVVAGELTEIDTIVSKNGCYAFPGGQIKDGLATGDGHLNLTFPTASCPGIVANPLLGPMQENGGPTPTMAIAPPSPAIDRVPATAAAGCTPTDQRGITRPQPAGGRCDIGAYEFKP
jgi:CSLREA domain-containing protein